MGSLKSQAQKFVGGDKKKRLIPHDPAQGQFYIAHCMKCKDFKGFHLGKWTLCEHEKRGK